MEQKWAALLEAEWVHQKALGLVQKWVDLLVAQWGLELEKAWAARLVMWATQSVREPWLE